MELYLYSIGQEFDTSSVYQEISSQLSSQSNDYPIEYNHQYPIIAEGDNNNNNNDNNNNNNDNNDNNNDNNDDNHDNNNDDNHDNNNDDNHDNDDERERREKGSILIVTDPSKANIFIDGVLQPLKTSTILTDVRVGLRTITLTKPGYLPYTERIAVGAEKIVKVCAILQKVVNIISFGIITCTGPNILSCPITTLDCPPLITALSYINFLAIINSIIQTTVTIRFAYTLNNIRYNVDVNANLSIGLNAVYAFSTNIQYIPNTAISLDDVSLI